MTIKTQGGKVITKDGKVSCECCFEIDPCTTTLLPDDLLEIIKNSAFVSATFDFPAMPDYGINQVSGFTGPLDWDGSSAFWINETPAEEPSFYIELKGRYLLVQFLEVGPTFRYATFHDKDYPTGATFPCAPLPPGEIQVQWQFFNIPVNGINLPAWQRPLQVGAIPPADYPTPTMSITFS